MAYELSYAEVPFALDRPEVLELIERRIPLEDLRETLPRPHWPGRTLAGLALPSWPERPRLRIGDFFYPSGASRWAEFHGLASTTQLAAMKAIALPEGGPPIAAAFILKADPSDGDALASGGIETELWMLPPRPLAIYDPLLEGLWLVTLVDERYYGQFRAATTRPADDDGVTWTDLLEDLATALDIDLDHSAINAAYGFPPEDSPFWAGNESAALLLDAAAWNVGRLVVRNLDGTYSLQTPVEAEAAAATNRALAIPIAGGDALAADPGEEQSRATPAVLPATVTVTFPKFVTNGGWVDGRDERDWIRKGFGYGDVYSKEITLADAGYDYAGHPGTWPIRDTARAYYDLIDDDDPTNQADLDALALQLATDFYDAQSLTGLDEVYPGIRAWEPEGLHDLLWVYRGNWACTRVARKPWNFGVMEMQHRLGDPGLGDECCVQFVKVTSATTDNGRYPGRIRVYDPTDNTAVDGAYVWVYPGPGEEPATLAADTIYPAKEIGEATGDADPETRPVFRVLAEDDGYIPAKLTGASGSAYSWTEQEPSPGGGWADKVGGRSGVFDLYERNLLRGLPVDGSVFVWIYPGAGDFRFEWDYPLVEESDGSPSIKASKIRFDTAAGFTVTADPVDGHAFVTIATIDSLIVQELDEDPSVEQTTTINFDQDTGLQVEETTSHVATVTMNLTVEEVGSLATTTATQVATLYIDTDTGLTIGESPHEATLFMNLTIDELVGADVASQVRHIILDDDSGLTVVETDANEATISMNLTVKEQDGSPSYTKIKTITFDQADGFVLTQPNANEVRIDLNPATFSLTVREQDASPSYTGINTITFDQADGFVLTQPGAGEVRIDFVGAGTSLTVSEQDTTPTLTPITHISFDNHDGFIVANPAPGPGSTVIANVDLNLDNYDHAISWHASATHTFNASCTWVAGASCTWDGGGAGTFTVNRDASFTADVSVGGDFEATGNTAVFDNTTFEVKNAGSSVLLIDSQTVEVVADLGVGGVILGSTSVRANDAGGASVFQIRQGGVVHDGIDATVGYRKDDGVTNGTLTFRGGILTASV